MGGGGGPQNSTVTQTTTTLPEYAEPYWKDLQERVAYQTSLPYQTYQGQRTADFSPYEQEAMARMTELGMSGTNPALMEASRLAYNVGNDQFIGVNTGIESGYQATNMGDTGGYNPNFRSVGYEPGRLDDGAMLQNYMSPYMQNVVDVEKREASRQADIRNQNIGLEAGKQGGLGGYRDAIMRSENERNLSQQMGDIQTRGQQSAFADAKQSFEADRSARGQLEQFGQGQFGLNTQVSQFGASQELQQYQIYEQARQQAAAMGMTAQQANQAAQIAVMNSQLGYQQNQLGASSQLAQYANQQQASEMERLGLVQGIGSQQRQLAQTGLDVGYQNFKNQQAYPFEMLSFINNMLQGGAMTPGSTSAMFGPQPTTTQQLLGSGVAGAGLWNAFNSGGGG